MVRHRFSIFQAVVISLAASCAVAQDDKDTRPHPAVERAVLETALEAYGEKPDPVGIRDLPIGVFDSGTGGLTVLEHVLAVDAFGNGTTKERGDGRPDFASESFIFLADQANMPYGNYPVVDKGQVLDDLILRDAEFLLGRKYQANPHSTEDRRDKLPVKAIVIACNTATAYGKTDIERMLQSAKLDIKVIGVIDAGAEGALQVFSDGRSGSIGVVPTRGTVLSGAYPAAIRRLAAERGLKQEIRVFQQGAYGLAGAIDGAPEFIARDKADHGIRDVYRGPSVSSQIAPIDLSILERYDFDFSNNQMLYAGALESPKELQLNSAENYLRYHLVSLLEQMRSAPDAEPLRAVVMGCTHFPFYRDTFRSELTRLYNLRENGEFVYRKFMDSRIELIDPAVFTARQLYLSLCEDNKLCGKQQSSDGRTRAEFFITVPCRREGVLVGADGAFTYDYKYGRPAGMAQCDFLTVPLRSNLLDRASEERLRSRIPRVYEELQHFRVDNSKSRESKPPE